MTPTTSHRSIFTFFAGTALVALVLSSCGGSSTTAQVASLTADTVATSDTSNGSGDGQAADSGDFRTQLLAYAKCMRDNGVDYPDPQFDANGSPQFNGSRTQFDAQRNDPVFQKAETACQDKRPQFGAGFQLDPEQQAATKENLLKYAKCMRDKGIDYPDPTFGSDGRPQFGANGPGGDINRNDPAFEAARSACQTEVGGNFGFPGFGGDNGPPTTQGGA
jgi:hypothetical protein